MASNNAYSMDQLREPDNRALWRRIAWGALALVVVAVCIVVDRVWLRAGVGIELEDFAVAQVTRGDLPIEVQGAGTLTAVSERSITAPTAGVVEEIFVQASSEVAPGDRLVSLASPRLQQVANQERLNLAQAEAEHRSHRATATDQRLSGEERVLVAQVRYDESRLKLEAQAELWDKQAVSEIDYKTQQLHTDQAKAQLDFEHRRFAELSASLEAGQAAQDARLEARREALREAERNVRNLQVTSDLGGTVRALLVQPGQRVGEGEPIAQVVDTTRLMGVVRVPEFYASHLAPGQPVTVSALDAEISGVVSRVDPAVTQGSVTVDVELADALPPGARPALSIRATIRVAELKDALFVRRPTQVRDMSAGDVFRLTADRQFAQRVAVRYGLGTLRHIEVLEGLAEGDAVILGDTARFDDEESVAIR